MLDVLGAEEAALASVGVRPATAILELSTPSLRSASWAGWITASSRSGRTFSMASRNETWVLMCMTFRNNRRSGKGVNNGGRYRT
jgi:hypothetical protein